MRANNHTKVTVVWEGQTSLLFYCTQDFTLPTKTHNERIILFSERHNFNIVIIATTVINSWFIAQLKWVPLFQHSNGVNGLSLWQQHDNSQLSKSLQIPYNHNVLLTYSIIKWWFKWWPHQSEGWSGMTTLYSHIIQGAVNFNYTGNHLLPRLYIAIEALRMLHNH